MATKQPRGIRNHNPGNIRISNDKWQGLAPVQTDGAFFQFTDATYGIRALARLLINYQDKYNLRTITQIINRWAPPSENNTQAYIDQVEKHTGFNAYDFLDMHKYEHLEPLVRAIILHENGTQPYTDSQITKGLVLAGVEPRKQELSKSKTIKAAQVAGAATVITPFADVVAQVAPAFGLLGAIAQYAPYVLAIIAVAAIGFIVWDRIDDRRKGIR